MPSSRTLILRHSWLLCLLLGCSVHSSYSTHAETHVQTGTRGSESQRHASHDDGRRDDAPHDPVINRGRDLTVAVPGAEAASSPSAATADPSANDAPAHAASVDEQSAAAKKQERDAKRASERERLAEERRKRAEAKKARDAQLAADAARKRADTLERVEQAKKRVELSRQERLTASVKRKHDQAQERERARQAKLDAMANVPAAKPDAGDHLQHMVGH